MAFRPGIPETELLKLERDWWRSLVQDVFINIRFPRFEDFFAEVFEYFRGKDAWQLFDEVIPTLTALNESGLRLAVISNFDSRLDDLLRALELSHFFEAVHISSRVGTAKPDARIFIEAVNRHAVEPGAALHVGDGLREDAEGAAAAGIQSVLLDRDNKFFATEMMNRINSLDQLVGLLGN